jgi:protein SCO1/2
VSFDHREQTELAATKRRAVIGDYGHPGAAEHWHFLTGVEPEIRKLTDSVGYGFRWNQTKNDFDHRAALIFVSPTGKITRYLSGFQHDPQTFRLAIVEASEGEVGTALDRFYLSCYGYDPRTGTYSSIGPMVMSIGGALTLAALAALLFVLWRKERRQGALAPAS